MDRRKFLRSGSSVAVGSALFPLRHFVYAAVPPLPSAGADGWISLLNGRDLNGWYSVLSKSGKGAAEQRGMVTIEENMLHIMGNEAGPSAAEAGYLATTQDFENVHIRVEYKWGVKRFGPRAFSKRDNGLLYGVVGPDKVWPTCVECQIEEGDVGDAFLLGTRGIQDQHPNGLFGQNLTTHGWDVPPTPSPETSPPPGSTDITRKIKDGNFENLDTWNVVEVVWQGDRAAHIVNGRAVNALSKLEQPDSRNAGTFIPLTRGKIAIELEYAEIWFRRIEVKALG
jgi:Domain of Unknown Function (DUF1080)